MKLADFDYQLPEQLIAQYPTPVRSHSRLLCLHKEIGTIRHEPFPHLLQYLHPGDLIIFNDTKVIPARLLGHKSTGGKVEVFIERLLGEQEAVVLIRASKAPAISSTIILAEDCGLKILERQQEFYRVQLLAKVNFTTLLETLGHIPLPPYIKRADEITDKERYQNIFAKHAGAVAAPTAGLHFDETILAQLHAQKIQIDFITLHVGAGTFQPVRVENIEQHAMHQEFVTVGADLCQRIRDTKAQGKRVIAVGTTVVRSLETAAQNGTCEPYSGDTNIFIYPGYTFKCVDALITNFHAPQTTLLMLVCAFASFQSVMNAYQEAIIQQYRFFSYGDAMFLYA